MKTRFVVIAGLALVLVIGVVVAGRWLAFDEQGAVAVSQAEASAPALPKVDQQLPALTNPAPVTAAATDSPLLPVEESHVDAVVSLEEARLHGDSRAPAVVRTPEAEKATAAELADPDAYARYEARQNQRLYKNYLKAADTEIPKLQADIAKARGMGMTPEQLAEGEEKLRRIQAMRDQLASEHPELTVDAPAR